MTTALDLAIAAQDRRQRVRPIEAVAVIDESMRAARAESSVRGQARALLAWAGERGEGQHPVITDLRAMLERWDAAGKAADSGSELVDAIVAIYFNLPDSCCVVAQRDPKRWGIL